LELQNRLLTSNFIDEDSTQPEMPKVLMSFEQVRIRSVIHVVGVVILLGVFTSGVKGQSQYLNSFIYSQDFGSTYLGKASASNFEADSITNQFGTYGSSFSSFSIRNSFSQYGSAFSQYSAYNAFATSPPILYNSLGTAQAYLTKNLFLFPRIDPDVLINYLNNLGSPPIPSNAILMSGDYSYSFEGSVITLGVDKVTNYRTLGSVSGTLAVQIWATQSVYSSGTLNGFKIAEKSIGTLNGGFNISNILEVTALLQPPDGNYNLVFVLAEWNGSAYSTVHFGNFTQRQTFGVTVIGPSITANPTSSTVNVGDPVSLSVSANGSTELKYQWFLGATPIFGANNPTYTIDSANESDAGDYSAEVANSAGSATSNVAVLTVNVVDTRSILSNLSVRTSLTSGQNLVVGAVVQGGSKNILMRAGGPALNQFSLSGMPDPKMDLFGSDQVLKAANDDWNSALGNSFTTVGAYSFEIGSKDSALVQQLDGPFTVRVGGNGDGGTVLVEAYDLSGESSPRLVNVSARNKVGTGSDILIAGFVIKGTIPMRVLIRAVGPTLADFGLTDVLADPKVEVFNSSNSKIFENDNWSSSLTSTFSEAGAFLLPSGSKDAALVAEIPPGAYTVQASGADGGVGEAIIEIYELK